MKHDRYVSSLMLALYFIFLNLYSHVVLAGFELWWYALPWFFGSHSSRNSSVSLINFIPSLRVSEYVIIFKTHSKTTELFQKCQIQKQLQEFELVL